MKYFLTCLIPSLLFVAGIAAVYVLEFRLLKKWIGRRLRKEPAERMLTSKSAIILHALSVFGVLCFAWSYYVEPYRLEINTITIPTEKLKNTSFRVVQISDLHCDKKIRLESRLVEEINKLHADLIVFTGDSLNNKNALLLLQATLRSMKASLGKYAVRGNVDDRFWEGIDLFADTGFQELTLDTVSINKNGEHLGLCGLDFKNGPQSYQAIKDLSSETFNILLFHKSDLISYLEKDPIDLYLCGHTHGGQVALPFYGALMTQSRYGKKYEAGLYQFGHIQLYVNRGIGMSDGWLPRVRFFARPEITVFEIVPKFTVRNEGSPD